MKLRVLSVLAVMALLFASLAQAQIPRTISYQGYLTSANGTATNSTGLSMLFNIYSGPTGGAALHSETQNVAVSNGIFNVLLGTTTALILPFDVAYYLGVTVGTDAEMSPRRPLAASPYAIRAASASSAASADTLAASAIVPGAQIANASVSAAKLASSSCTDGQVLQYNGTSSAWVCATPSASSGGTVTNINTGSGLAGGPITSSGTVSLASNQLLPTIACATGQTVNWSGSAWLCSTPASSGGTVTNISTGSGLAGGPITSSGTVSLASSQLLPTIACAAGQTVNWSGSAWLCSTPASSGGTVTSISTGPGLAGGPITSSGTVSLASSQLLPAIACATGQTVKWSGSAWLCSASSAPSFNAEATQANSVGSISGLGLAGTFASITVGTDGLPVMSFLTNNGLRVAKCGNVACSSSAAATIAGVDSVGTSFSTAAGAYTSIIIGNDGLPVISYYSFGSLKVVKCGDTACSANNTITVIDATTANVGQYSSIAIGDYGRPVIAYYDAINKALKVAKCTNPACTTSGVVTVDAGVGYAYTIPNVGQFTSINIGADGLPIISYYDVANLALKVAKCGDAFCSTNNIISTLGQGTTSQTVVGQHSSMAIGADGLPIISYYFSDSSTTPATAGIGVAKCTNVACTGYSAGANLDYVLGSKVGQYSSITIGADGLPIVSYYDETNSTLKIAKCNTVDCATSSVTTVLTPSNASIGTVQAGMYTAITIGSDGLPLVVYSTVPVSGSTPLLKVVKCASTSCLPYYRRR